jgi:hypothetical protein
VAIEGGCACGAVRYRATAAPLHSMICHCASCRRAAAAPGVPWVTFPRAAFAFTTGQPATHASSPPVRRGFCAACGTPLTYAHEGRPDEIDVTTCSLDDPAAFPPTYHAQTGDDLPWVRFGDGLPAFSGWKPAD